MKLRELLDIWRRDKTPEVELPSPTSKIIVKCYTGDRQTYVMPQDTASLEIPAGIVLQQGSRLTISFPDTPVAIGGYKRLVFEGNLKLVEIGDS